VPFIATGAILGYVVGLLLAARPVADEAAQRLQNYSFNSQAGYLGLFGALMGALLGAVVFVVLDRRS
jgi:H+/Cl- antiporter ClcA